MLKSPLLLVFAMICVSLISQGQSKHEKDIQAIKSMLGCYDVTFQYTETFAPDVDYEQAYDYTSAAKELAILIEDSPNKISIQHLLVISDTMVIKHWRQDWIYEANTYWPYEQDFTWNKKEIGAESGKGTWTQEVYQVDDSPRYSGYATWTHVDGVSRWIMGSDSPLPRREYSKRSDYNVMHRGNTVEINNEGWVHEQDNKKIIRSDEGDKLLVQEKGFNIYKKTDINQCKAAADWWTENEKQWEVVRDVWASVFDGQEGELALNNKVDDKALFEVLFYSQKEFTKLELNEIIKKYVK